MKVLPIKFEDVLLVEPQVFTDPRGHFMETFQQERYEEAGIAHRFVQDNFSFSSKGTLRGLHYQLKQAQAKLVQVTWGRVFDVAVDIRRGSPTFGHWAGVELSSENHRQLYIPQGFAHGFFVLSETAHFQYKCSDYYTPDDEFGILWSDPEIGIEWPAGIPLLSGKDRAYPFLDDVPRELLPKYQPVMVDA